MVSQPRVPPEIWSHILQYVPGVEQTKLLDVSHRFHAIALELLFSAVKIYFIGGERAAVMLNTVDNQEFAQEITAKLMTRSWEILRRIIKDPSFAKIVKSLTVIASDSSMGIFEKLCLADALAALPYLRTFRWYGASPYLTEHVAGNIPTSIQSISLQTYVPSCQLMQRFTDIKSLALTTPFLYPDDEDIHDASIMDEDLLASIDRNHFNLLLGTMALDSLRSLTLDAECVSGIPVRVLSNLNELTICITTECESLGLDLIFRHASQLESLTLFGLIGHEIFLSFLAEPSCLPSLHSFRLTADNATMAYTPRTEFVNVLFKFIEERTKLRRLYLRIPSIHLEDTSHLDLIGKLKCLEVFGFHTGITDVNVPFLQALCDCLPKTLRAFHLAMDWCGSPLLFLVDYLAQLPQLGFVHFYGAYGRLPILLVDIATEVPNLELVGLNRALWTVDKSGPELDLKKWPRWKIKFCTDEDFSCEDYFWLFQYN